MCLKFEERICGSGMQFNKTEDHIIQYIRSHREVMRDIPIKKMAKELYVSPNAIVRLTKKLGYTGFSEMKFSLQREDEVEDRLSVAVYESDLLDRLPENIVRTVRLLNEAELQRMVSGMLGASRIFLAGMEETRHFSTVLRDTLHCLDKETECIFGSASMAYAIRNFQPGDCLVLLQAFREPPELVQIARAGCERRVQVYGLLDFGASFLEPFCDLSLSFWCDERHIHGHTLQNRSGLMVLVSCLCEGLRNTFAQEQMLDTERVKLAHRM